MSRYPEIDLSKIKTLSVQNRKSKIHIAEIGSPVRTGGSFRDFWDSLPRILASGELRELADRIAGAVRNGRPVLFLMGAHVVKVGLSPVVVDLLERRILKAVAMNGAGAIHDTEMAYFGGTSEDVAEALQEGTFGMVRETADRVNRTVREGAAAGLGFGEALGKRIAEEKPPFHAGSILGTAYRMGVPATVHVAVGTDIVHQHPTADGASIGEATLRDFRIFCACVSGIGDGGVVLLFGSSVILPEVFLKALTVARNINGPVRRFTTANFDMIRQYRPRVNVVERPTQHDGLGMNFIGHHEILLPLLAAGVKEKLG